MDFMENFHLGDGGLETWLLFHQNIDLPEFAAFIVYDNEKHRKLLVEKWSRELISTAQRHKLPVVIDCPTWRLSSSWCEKLGLGGDEAVRSYTLKWLDEMWPLRDSGHVKLSFQVGPRGDGYVATEAMTVSEAQKYHSVAITAAASSPHAPDLFMAMTMTNSNEATGVALACASSNIPYIISYTVETNGLLPSGESLRHGVEAIEAATKEAGLAPPLYYMVNCAYPTHFQSVIRDDKGPWLSRLRGLRCNASSKSHEELDNATELDAGNPEELSALCCSVSKDLPYPLLLCGGCCGTDISHIDRVAAAFQSAQ
eukprot:Rmarinus@m.17292